MDNKNPREIPASPLSDSRGMDSPAIVMSEDEKRFRKILESVGREGTESLLKYLTESRFFTAPGSVRHHSNWKGGLVNHSLKVYDCAMRIREEMIQKDPSLSDELKEEEITVAALLHDICKADLFFTRPDGSPSSKKAGFNVGGHGYKSVILILFHGFKLHYDELLAIRWHMGPKHSENKEDIPLCEEAKKKSALVRLIIHVDHLAATS